jgi:hypothetical protein
LRYKGFSNSISYTLNNSLLLIKHGGIEKMELTGILKCSLFIFTAVFFITAYQILAVRLSRDINDLIDIHIAKKMSGKGGKNNKIIKAVKTGAAAEIESEVKKNLAMDNIVSSAKRVEDRAGEWLGRGHEKEEV